MLARTASNTGRRKPDTEITAMASIELPHLFVLFVAALTVGAILRGRGSD